MPGTLTPQGRNCLQLGLCQSAYNHQTVCGEQFVNAKVENDEQEEKIAQIDLIVYMCLM